MTFIKFGLTPPLPKVIVTLEIVTKIKKNLPPPPSKNWDIILQNFFWKMIDLNKNWIKSVQFGENRDNIVLNLSKKRENTESYHANVQKSRLKMKTLREGNFVIQNMVPLNIWIHIFEKINEVKAQEANVFHFTLIHLKYTSK